VYLHREPHSSGPFDMQLVYEDMPQESGSYQCKWICKQIRDMETNMAVNMGDKSVYIYGPSGPRDDKSINKSKKHPK